jgi:hypothetical protein
MKKFLTLGIAILLSNSSMMAIGFPHGYAKKKKIVITLTNNKLQPKYMEKNVITVERILMKLALNSGINFINNQKNN